MRTSIVVANHGRDLTQLKASLPSGVEFIEVDLGFERSKQRNIGILKATGDVLMWLDSDQTISKGLVKECEDLVRMGFSAIYIPEVIVAKSFFGKIRAFEREFYIGTAIDVPRAVWMPFCVLFNESLIGPEDADWGRRIRGLRTVSRNVLYHHDDVSFFEYCRKKAYYTKSMKRYAELNPGDKCLNFRYRCWTVFTEKGKWRKLLRHPILTIGIIFLLAVRGIIYAKR